MKYLVFTVVLLCVPPAAMFLSVQRRLLWLAPLVIFPTLLLFNNTAINFFSNEWYRGTSRGMEVSLIYLVAMTILGALTLRRGLLSPFPSCGSVLYGIYFLLCILSTLNVANGLFAFFELWKMVMIYLVYLAIYHYLEFTHGDCRILYLGLAIITVLIFLSAVKQHVTGIYQIRTYFEHQNSLAMFMSLLGTLFLSRFINERKRWPCLLALFLCALASGTLLRTYSRGAIVCYPAGCAITLLTSVALNWRGWKVMRVSFLVGCAMVGFVLFLPRILERFDRAPSSSGQARIDLAVAAVNMIKDEPVFGVGINNWGIKVNPPYPYNTNRDPAKGVTDDYKDGIVETIYLLTAAECGIPALTMLLIFFFYHLWAAFSVIRLLRHTPQFYWAPAALGGLSSVYVQSILEWVLKQQVNFIEMLIFFAIIGYLKKNAKQLRLKYADAPPTS